MSKQIIQFGEGLNTAQLGGYYRKHNGRAKKSIKIIKILYYDIKYDN